MRSPVSSPQRRLVLGGLAALLVGCAEEPVRVYHVAAEAAREGMATAGAHDHEHEHDHSVAVKWTKPEAWTELPPDETRLGNYTAPGGDGSTAEITVIRLGGTAGGTLANVNRWRGQLGLEPVTEETLDSTTLPTADGGGEIEVFDLDGGEAGSMLVAQLPAASETWFFKMTGSRAVVEDQRDAFMELLGSVAFDAGGAHEHAHGTEPVAPKVAAPVLEVPEGWEEAEGSAMRVASFRVSGEEGRGADISVVSLKGDGGGLEPNLNLWRTQVQLRDLTDEELRAESVALKSGLGDLTLVHFESTDDLLGEGRKAAILGAMGQAGERTWFFKMSGDLGVVAAEKAKFIRFVETATPP